MQDINLLENMGLSPAEAKIYLSALELGKSLPAHLAKKAGVKRPTLYKLLPKLLKSGLLSETIKGRRRLLVAENPEIYLNKKQAEIAEFENILPSLKLLLSSASTKPVITFYEGIEGIKKVYLDSLRAGKPILEFLGLEKIHPEIENYTTRYYIKERIRRRIPVKIIVSGNPLYGKFKLVNDTRALREVKKVDTKLFPIPIDAYIYGDTFSLIVYRTDSEPTGMIIKSKEISTALKSLFNLAWMV